MSDPIDQQPRQTQPDPFEGLMRINKANNSETIRIQQFVLENKGVVLNELMLEVDYQTSVFAIAAMFKGLQEFYFKPAGMKAPDQTIEQSEKNLKIWEEMTRKKRTGLILP